MQTLKERLDTFLRNKNLSQAKFAEIVGLSVGFANNVKNSISTKSLTKIKMAFPDLNTTWLLTGEGEMLANNTKEIFNHSDTCNTHIVPLLPLSAIGGSLNDFTMSVRKFECEQIVSPIEGVDFGITVSGESMSPEYPSGSKVLIQKINEKAFIDWGRTYVLDTCNGVVIKKLFPTDDKDPSKVKCVSVNPAYPPFEVSLKDVYGVYRVLMSLALK